MTTPHRLTASIVALSFASLLAWPATAEAQRRGPGHRPRGGPGIHGGLRVGPGFGVATLAQRPWGRYGPWGPYSSPYRNYSPYNEFSASARIEVEPKYAEVFVDGSFAGLVDEFDGFWQRLSVRPGDHVIALYLDGYRTVRHELYFSPGSTHGIKGTMEKLGAGESSGPKPKTEAPAQTPPPPPPAAQAPQPARFGTIALMVLPADAEILVDGERWTGAVTSRRLAIQLAPGRHQIEVRKEGFSTYMETVLIRSDATLTLNVSLTKK